MVRVKRRRQQQKKPGETSKIPLTKCPSAVRRRREQRSYSQQFTMLAKTSLRRRRANQDPKEESERYVHVKQICTRQNPNMNAGVRWGGVGVVAGAKTEDNGYIIHRLRASRAGEEGRAARREASVECRERDGAAGASLAGAHAQMPTPRSRSWSDAVMPENVCAERVLSFSCGRYCELFTSSSTCTILCASTPM